jgi:hypothetical protein
MLTWSLFIAVISSLLCQDVTVWSRLTCVFCFNWPPGWSQLVYPCLRWHSAGSRSSGWVELVFVHQLACSARLVGAALVETVDVNVLA